MQSGLYAGTVRRALVQELTEYQVVISPKPEETAAACRLLKPYALLLEVTGYTPWDLEERLKIRESVRRDVPECRIVLIVDENNMTTRDGVFAAGDVVHGSLTVVHAVNDAKNAAEAMIRYMEEHE